MFLEFRFKFFFAKLAQFSSSGIDLVPVKTTSFCGAFFRANFTATPWFVRMSGFAEWRQRMAAMAECLCGVFSADAFRAKHIRLLGNALKMVWIDAARIVALMIDSFLVSFRNVANHQRIHDARCLGTAIQIGQPKGRVAIGIVRAIPTPAAVRLHDFRPEALNIGFRELVSHLLTISFNCLERCDANEGQAGRWTVQAERLNRETPKAIGDAIVWTHGNWNHERIAEMTIPALALRTLA